MSLITSEGDQIWIDLPSKAILKKKGNQQNILLEKDETIKRLNNEIATLNDNLRKTIAQGNRNINLLVSDGYVTIIEFWKGYVNLVLGTYTAPSQFQAGKEIALAALNRTQSSVIFKQTGAIAEAIRLLNASSGTADRATLQNTLGAAFVDMDKALKDYRTDILN